MLRVSRTALVGGVAAIVLTALILLWQDGGYWDYSDGVYAMSGRLMVEGQVPYRDFVGAQPPVFFGLAALLVWIDDSVGWLRIALSGVDLVLAGLVGVAVRRLTHSPLAAVLAALGALLTPWALHEHAQLTPETFAAPLLLGAALAASGRRTAWLTGLLAALATFTKLAFALPAVLLLLAARVPRAAATSASAATTSAFAPATDTTTNRIARFARERPALWWAGGFVALLAGVSVALFGTDVIDAIIVAQGESGRVSLDYLAGLWAQAGWNLIVVLVPAILAVVLRKRTKDAQLLRLVGTLAVGSVLLLLTLFKQGSYLNVLVVIEPPLLVLAAAGITWAVQDWRSVRTHTPRIALVAIAACLCLWAIQVVALVAKPDDPVGFARPGSATAHGRLLTPDQLAIGVGEARVCPGTSPYAGPPAIAFRAGRRVPGDQPDPFILKMPTNARFFRLTQADVPQCVPVNLDAAVTDP